MRGILEWRIPTMHGAGTGMGTPFPAPPRPTCIHLREGACIPLWGWVTTLYLCLFSSFSGLYLRACPQTWQVLCWTGLLFNISLVCGVFVCMVVWEFEWILIHIHLAELTSGIKALVTVVRFGVKAGEIQASFIYGWMRRHTTTTPQWIKLSLLEGTHEGFYQIH